MVVMTGGGTTFHVGVITMLFVKPRHSIRINGCKTRSALPESQKRLQTQDSILNVSTTRTYVHVALQVSLRTNIERQCLNVTFF